MDPATFLVAEQAVSTTIEGAALASIGIAQKTLPLSATFTRISSPGFLSRSYHTLTVVNDHAYIFGGETEHGELAGNEVHIVALPLKSKGPGEPDYKCVPALGEEGGDGSVPTPRAGHSACRVGEKWFVFGGKGNDGQVLKEEGRVWVFDTTTLKWGYFNPTGAIYPDPRFYHASASIEQPLPPGQDGKLHALGSQIQESISQTLPKLISKPSPPVELYGTLFISSGVSSPTSEPLEDNWAFTIASQTWSQLPSISFDFLSPPRLATANNHLYLITGSAEVASEIHQLPIPRQILHGNYGDTDIPSEPPSPWLAVPFPTNPLIPGPRPRKGAGLLPITTGNGRFYLLYLFGEKASTTSSANEGELRTFWSDIFSYQLPASTASAASIKDATRSTMGIGTGEGTWAEVNVIANEEGSKQSGAEGKSHPGPRGWFGSDVIGRGDVVLWGGINGKEEVEGDGWIIHVS
jgi:hypothetical protein